MKNLILAPAAVLAAGAIALSGTSAFAATGASFSGTDKTHGQPRAQDETESAAPQAKAILSITPQSIKASELTTDKGVSIQVSGLPAGVTKVNFKVTQKVGDKDIEPYETSTGVEDGKAGFDLVKGDASADSDDYVGSYTVTATYEGALQTLSGSFKITTDNGDTDPSASATATETETATETPSDTASPTDTATPTDSATPSQTATGTPTQTATATPTETTQAPVKVAKLGVEPKKISAKNFVNEKKGVHLSVTNLKPGTDVKFTVTPKGGSVTGLDRTVAADENGTARWVVYGVSASNPSAYVGEYTVKAVPEHGKALKSGFTVTAGDPNAGGGDDSDDNGPGDNGTGSGDNGSNDNGSGNGGSELPQTGGAELGAVVAGSILLLVGGASIMVTRRRKTQH
ncbi:LPXTG cell wall anchor domain-containing protein [Brevibacterium moorei]|uniref:LPXTG cell wall anchor domain-containing protein n=1 Tax=Brevibacterium moorei TaxID=2968457 RepID=UPI00211BB500|nr:LPXTG cell wall anchor domain-containing protein [Brevibacterium sp. 68QC2CO]MCQ9386470.1 LPXTG cell wall anchor domain-containing protein [Brevibacterium sp. 68QC2CO]